jgi:N-acetylglucosamine kinase-like BadF-type ATPase
LSFYLGIDGGQSSTTAWIGNQDGQVLGIGSAGPCNHVKGPGGREKFLNALRGSVGLACHAAGLSPNHRQFVAACLGLSGGPADKAALIQEELDLGASRITHDAEIALLGALAGEPGVIVIAGTGSIAFGNNGTRPARAGGWGYIWGDEGGAFDIVRQAMRAALRLEEGWGPRTILKEALLEASGAVDMNDALHRCYTEDYPRGRVAQWAALVDEAADAGDAVATEILRGAGQQLAVLASAVYRQLFGPEDPVSVAPVGGVFRSARVLEHFGDFLRLDDRIELVSPRYCPAAGALIGAYRVDGKTINLTNAPAWNEG